ncbi:hypothetical protein COU57_02680 [Candidatus Pacearchaeota archaeon CG10_big_fil_rev_8_21_14_0_10_32_14]|nr:MAG: hypothetical protein COU57_02680 [Candidatus Pacearchaeota archaeon CG10_big_fil_rev_8_21_14_0_10_32_14]
MVKTKSPIVVVNFKNHLDGMEVLRLAKKIERAYENAIVCVPAVYLREISSNTKLKVYAQHINDKDSGSTTGYLTAQSVSAVGARGTLLNHSEHKVPYSVLHNLIKRCDEEGLESIVCIESPSEVRRISRWHYKPYAIAYEDPILIGSGKSVTTYNTRGMIKFVEVMEKYGHGIIPLCGAGISKWRDVEESMTLGCDGVLVASAITKAKRPEKFFGK